MRVIAELTKRRVLRVIGGYCVVCFVILQIADVTFAPLNISDGVLRIIIAIMVLGLPLVAYLSWVFDLGPGTQLERTPGGRPGLELSFAILAMALFTIGAYFVVVQGTDVTPAPDNAFQDKVVSTQNWSDIAVLPLSNLSSDPEQAYLADGIAEEIINLLATNANLRVTSRQSSFVFRNSKLTLKEIGTSLGVTHILLGSIRVAGNRVRVSVQLAQVSNDTYLWNETYERAVTDLFALQDELAAKIAASLNVTFYGAARAKLIPNHRAFVLYQQAKHRMASPLRANEYPQIESMLNEALSLEPDYVPAIRELGRLQLQMQSHGVIPPEEAVRKRWDLISRALDIEPDDPVSNTYRGFQLWVMYDDLENAARHFQKALQIAPTHEDVLRPTIQFLNAIHRTSDSLVLANYLASKDPLCGNCKSNLGRAYEQNGLYDDARRVYLEANREASESSIWAYPLARLETYYGDPEVGLRWSQSITTPTLRLMLEAVAYFKMGDEANARSRLGVLSKDWPDAHFEIANVHAALDEPDPAFEHLLKSQQAGHGLSLALPNAPGWLDHLEDERWQDYLMTLKRTPERLDAIELSVPLEVYQSNVRN